MYKRNSELVVAAFASLFILSFFAQARLSGADVEETDIEISFHGHTNVSNVHFHSKVVVCYVGTWAFYRTSEGQYDLLDQFDPDLCTHLIYCFAGLNNVTYELVPFDPNLDLELEGGKGWFKKVASLKLKHSHLKVLLAIGGWNEGSEKYSDMVGNYEKRKTFIESAVSTIRKYGFDGLDLDWEYPGQRGGRPEDRRHFTSLVRELRERFDKYGLMLTAAFGASQAIVDAAYELKALSSHLDHIHLMAYDYHGTWDGKTNHNAPLFSSADTSSVAESVEYFISEGASPDKIVLGLPFYGRTFLLTNDAYSDGSGIDRPAETEGFQGPFTKLDGMLGYNEICKDLTTNRGHWATYWDSDARVPFMRNGAKWITFDNPESLYQKVEYVVARKLKGAMIWSMDTDDFRGTCGGPRYPLLHSVNYALAVEESKRRTTPIVIPGGDKKNPMSTGSNTKAASFTFTLFIGVFFKCISYVFIF